MASSTTMTMPHLSHTTETSKDKSEAAMPHFRVSPLASSSSVNGRGDSEFDLSRMRPDTYAGLESLAKLADAHNSRETSKPSFFAKDECDIDDDNDNDNDNDNNHEATVTISSSAFPPRKVLHGGLDALAALAFEVRSKEETGTTPNNNSNITTESVESGLNSKNKISDSFDPHLFRANGITSASPSSSENDDDGNDSDSMPPPLPRVGRRRSASNPEGMEKWDSFQSNSRRHFVLPASILEEELAEASAAIQQRKMRQLASGTALPLPIPEEPGEEEKCDDSSASPDSVVDLGFTHAPHNCHHHHTPPSCLTVVETKPRLGKRSVAQMQPEEDVEEEEVDESNLLPEELLKRARSRLLEDLSEGNMSGEKGVLTLPHSLSKYKEVYNKNGRIGIYTPAERAAIIARFNKKRQRRVWNKKIRYNCRKSLADRRLRVKGRFVKRSEQEQLAKEIQARAEQEMAEQEQAEREFAEEYAAEKSAKCGAHKQPQGSVEDDCGGEPSSTMLADENMPDVNDPDANFDPTEEQPYRRLRRHTIT